MLYFNNTTLRTVSTSSTPAIADVPLYTRKTMGTNPCSFEYNYITYTYTIYNIWIDTFYDDDDDDYAAENR